MLTIWCFFPALQHMCTFTQDCHMDFVGTHSFKQRRLSIPTRERASVSSFENQRALTAGKNRGQSIRKPCNRKHSSSLAILYITYKPLLSCLFNRRSITLR